MYETGGKVQGMTKYYVRQPLNIMLSTKKHYVKHKKVTPCTPFRLFPTWKSALIGAVLRNVKNAFSLPYVGLYTGPLCCIVKHP